MPVAGCNARPAVAVFPWIGCGQCAACLRGEENICAAPRHLGIQADGGLRLARARPAPALSARPCAVLGRVRRRADVLGPHRLCGAQAAGRTAHAAHGPVLLVGMGGVGMMGLAIARDMFPHAPIVADIDAAQARCGARGRRRRGLRSGRCRRAQGDASRHRRRRLRGLRLRRLGPLARVRDRRAGQGRQGPGDRAVRRHLQPCRSQCSA